MIHRCADGATPSHKQGEFLFNGATSRETRAEAFHATQNDISTRRAIVLDAFRRAGSAGLTRIELAELLNTPPNHITRSVLDLLRSNDLLETGQRRKSRWGRSGAIIVLAGYLTHDIGTTST